MTIAIQRRLPLELKIITRGAHTCKRVKRISVMWLVVGADVELQGVDDGYQGSRFQVEVLRIARGKVLIQYKNFHVTDDPDSPLLTEIVDKNVLRPLPPKMNQTSWAVGEAVEAYYQDAWWIGFIRKYIAKGDTYLVSFGPGQEELNFPPPMLRTRQDYVKPKFSRKGAWKVYGFVPVRPFSNNPMVLIC